MRDLLGMVALTHLSLNILATVARDHTWVSLYLD